MQDGDSQRPGGQGPRVLTVVGDAAAFLAFVAACLVWFVIA